MEQHPVPQNIASYEFRLVGDMTLKQFLQVAAGALVALLFYATPLPNFIKWPLILLAGLSGTALAFMPLEERPLSAWIVAFVKAIYSPTLYSQGPTTTQSVFAPDQAEAPATTTPAGQPVDLASLGPKSQNEQTVISTFEEKEKTFTAKIISLFPKIVPPAKITEPVVAAARPNLVVEEVHIPTVPAPSIPPPNPPSFMPQHPATTPTAVNPILVGQHITSNPARFAPEAAPPTPPNTPNVVVGQVVDDTGRVLDGAILEIRDGEGRPVRALRTNKVGHFLTATPLAPGVYEIIIDKEGYTFNPIQFNVNNQVIAPIEIVGKKMPTSS